MSQIEGPAEALAALVADPGASGVFTDFDGTLAAIVPDPAAARPLPEAVTVLHRLARRFALVAVVSGRPARFLADHLELASQDGEGPSGLMALGLYGLETAEGGEVRSHPAATEWRPVVEAVADLADREAAPGVSVERKGLSLTLHYRNAPEARDWCRRWAAEQTARTGLVVHGARMSEELRPPIEVDKGTIVSDLAAGLGAACFLGDDRGDLPAFAALDTLQREQDGFTAVKVAVRSAEAPEELLAQADLVVDGPHGALALLRTLL